MPGSFFAAPGAGDDAAGYHRRSQRVLALCIAASLALHAAAFIALPGFIGERGPARVPVLDVVLVRPEVSQDAVPEALRPPSSVSPDVSRRRESRPTAKSPGAPVGRMDRAPEGASAQQATPSGRELLAESAPAPYSSAAESPHGGAVKTEEAPIARESAAVTPPAFNAAYLHNPPPVYPLVARRNGEQGTVTLRVLVTREGAPAQVSVEKTSGSGHLDHAALETVRTWRFVPARRGMEPIEAWVLVPIVFRLEGSS